VAFELAEFLYTRNQMPGQQIDTLMDLWMSSMLPHGAEAPFKSAKDMYQTIDASTIGDVKWESFKLKYEGIKPAEKTPLWMDEDYEVWYRNPHKIVKNILANTTFDGEVNTTPYRAYDTSGDRQYGNFMSGDWAWRQAVRDCSLLNRRTLITKPGHHR
jgi:Plavaka transposase